jgi:hypothetical protein
MPSRFARTLAGLLMAAMAILAARPAQAGNAALLEAWKARRQELSQKIADHLASQQRLPQNGTVRYTARVRPDPAAPGGLLLAVDEVNVVPAGAPPGARVEGPAASQAMDDAFAPRSPGVSVRLQKLDVPMGATVQGTLTIKDGKPVPPADGGPAADPGSADKAGQASAAPAEEEPSLLDKVLRALGW